MSTLSENEILKFTKEIIVAHVSHNTVDSDTLPDLIRNVHLSLIEARSTQAAREPEAHADAEHESAADAVSEAVPDGRTAPHPRLAAASTPAVPIAESVTPDYIICLEDG